MKNTQGSSSSSSGIGFVGLLQILFIALKLTNYIDWSWWWVMSPAIVSTSIVFLIIFAGIYIEVRRG